MVTNLTVLNGMSEHPAAVQITAATLKNKNFNI